MTTFTPIDLSQLPDPAVIEALDFETQRQGCARHLFIPDLVPGEVVDAGDDHVVYAMRDGGSWVNDAREESAAC